MIQVRKVGRAGPNPRIAIADDAGLIYSDDWRNGWLSGFKGIGCDVQVTNVAALRRAQPTGGIYSVRGSMQPKMLAQNILAWRPDLLWCHHGRAACNEAFLAEFRKRGIPTAVYLCDEPYETGETARYSPRFDFVFTMDPCTIGAHLLSRPRERRRGVFYLPACADTDLFRRPERIYDSASRPIPAFFLGNPTLKPRESYLRAIEKLVDGADIRYWPDKQRPVAKGHPKWIPASDHPKWYSSCRVGLNIHRDPGITAECFTKRVVHRVKGMEIPSGLSLCKVPPAGQGGTGFWNDANLPASHINPRFFEFAASGTLVVSDNHRSELDRLFPFVPQAQDVEHFVELVLYYLNHPAEAEEIGKTCSELVSRLHSYRHRATEVLIRVGLTELLRGDLRSYLAAHQDFLTPQDWQPLGGRSPSARTGPCERWSPASGLLSMRTSGSPSREDSLAVPNPWRSW